MRERLVRAGAALLAEEGASGVTLRAIARRAGVSHGAPRRYFPTRSALLSAVIAGGFQALHQAMTGAPDPAEPRRSRRYRRPAAARVADLHQSSRSATAAYSS